MATTSEEIRLVVKSELDKATKDLAKMSKKLVESDKFAKKNEKSFNGFKLSMIGVAAAVAGSIKFFKDAVSAASDLEEVSSKFNVVFGATPEIFELANSTVNELTQSYAMSTREARQYLSSVQDLLVPMGVFPGRAADMSAEVVKLSADLGSFNNVPTAQVMADIQSALVGNFETMKKYGVVLNETRVKQEAMNMGLFDGKGVLDAATKSQVAYALITRDSAAAVGDMVRTQDSFANVMKASGAFIENISAEIGQILLPSLSFMVKAFVEAAKSGNVFISALKVVSRAIAQLATGVGIAVDGVNQLSAAFRQSDAAERVEAIQGNIERFEAANRKAGESAEQFMSRIRQEGGQTLEQLKALLKAQQDAQDSVSQEADNRLDATTRVKNALKALEEKEVETINITTSAVQQSEIKKQQAKNVTAKVAQQLLNDQLSNEISFLEFTGQAREAALKKQEQEFLNLQTKFADDKLIKEELQVAHEDRMAEIKEEYRQKELEQQLNGFTQFVSLTQNAVNKVSAIFSQYFKNQNLQLNNDYKKRRNAIINNVKDEDERKKQLEALDAEFDKKKSDLAIRQAKLQKKLDLIQAIQAGALGVARALSTPPPPVGIAFASIIGALAATQVALIARQPIPAAAEGALIKGSPAGSLIQAGERGRSEAIVPLENEEAMDKIGGFGGVTNNININIENAFFDEEFPTEIAVQIDKALTKLAQDQNLRLARQL